MAEQYILTMAGGTLNNCTLSGNTGRYGGAVYFDEGGTLDECIINGNSSEYDGGGTYLYYGGTMDNCTLSNNSTPDYSGGAAYIDNGGDLTNCILSDNTTSYGGGVFISYIGTLSNCLLNGNSAWWGGGSYLYYGGMMNNCTFSKNTTNSNGGGAFIENENSWYNESLLNNCILWDNTAILNGNDVYVEYEGTIHNTCSSDELDYGVDCITEDPLFIDPVSDNYYLQASSPCIDTGNNAFVVGSYDLDGNDRIQNGTVDMGAYENGGIILPPEDVTISIADNIVTITWSAVGGVTYKIYSSDEPYDNFTEDTFGTPDSGSWSISIGETKKFYYVKAIN